MPTVLSCLVPCLLLLLPACGGEEGEAAVEESDASSQLDAIEAPRVLGTLDEDGLFESEELGFRLRIPEGFVHRTAFPDDQALPEHVVVFAPSDAASAGNLNVLVSDDGSRLLDQVLEDRLLELRSELPGFQLVRAGDHFTLSGYPGKRLDYAWLAEGRRHRQSQLLFRHRGAALTVTATWGKDGAPDAEEDPLVRALISFELF